MRIFPSVIRWVLLEFVLMKDPPFFFLSIMEFYNVNSNDTIVILKV